MRSLALCLATAALAACNPPVAKTSEVLTVTLADPGDMTGLAIAGGTVTANAAARDQMDRFTIKAHLGGVFQSDDVPMLGVSISKDLLSGTIASGSDEGIADATWDNVAFAACTDVGFMENEDGSCTAPFLVLLTSSRPTGVVLTMSGRAFADAFSGDKDSIVLDMTLDVAEGTL